MAAAGDAAKEYVAGAAAGVAQVVVGHPFDTVKMVFTLDEGFATKQGIIRHRKPPYDLDGTHFVVFGALHDEFTNTSQLTVILCECKIMHKTACTSYQPKLFNRDVKLQAHNTTAHGKVYKNAFHCTSRILVEEGIRGLYKGASSSFIGIAVESSLFFGTYSQAKQLLQGNYEDGRPHLKVIIPSAACSGALISCILTPTELTKCRMQVQGKDVMHGTRYSSPLDCAVKTLESEGLRGIFRGGLATLFREAIGNAVFFCTYEYSRYWMHNYLDSPQFSSSSHFVLAKDIGIGVMSGGISGMAFWTATLPLDVAKTIIQTDPDPHLSRNPFRVLSMVYKRAGMGGCYAGLGPTLARAFPANAAAIVAWEYSAKILGIKRG